MEFGLMQYMNSGMQKMVEMEKDEFQKNMKNQAYSLVLSDQDITSLIEHKNEVLKDYYRIEFGTGTIAKLATAFCSSPNIDQSNFKEALYDLLEIFYAFRDELKNEYSDASIIEAMQIVFEGTCHGSMELLAGTSYLHIASTIDLGEEPDDSLEERPLDLHAEEEEDNNGESIT